MVLAAHRCYRYRYPFESLLMKRLLPIFFVLGSLAACSDNPVAPPGAPPPALLPDTLGPLTSVPLSNGDRWTYDVTWTLRVLTPEGDDLYPADTRRASGVKEIVATETILGVSYQVERAFWRFTTGDSALSYRRFRQDETGLYRLIADLSAPPGALDGMMDIDEVRRLEFPLDLDTGWSNLAGYRSLVEAKEMVETAESEAEAYRILVTSHRDGTDNFIYVWFNEDGLVRRHNHSEMNAIDIESGERVLIVTDEIEILRTAPPR